MVGPIHLSSSHAVAPRDRRIYLPVLSGVQGKLSRPGQQLPEGGLQFIAVGKEWQPSKDVQTQARATCGHHQTPHIPEMPDRPSSHKRQKHIVILLALVLVHCLHLHGQQICHHHMSWEQVQESAYLEFSQTAAKCQ